jgi:hypothetical protein
VFACAAFLLAGCYHVVLPEGAPCQTTQECPTEQRCVLGICSSREAPSDASQREQPDASPGASPDAAMDASIDAPAPPIDAMILPCTTAGLACNGGTATTFPCGGHCWVRCTANVARTTAQTACAGWMGALGEIDDATEQSCVASHLASVTWIGLSQSSTAATPDTGWTWNDTTQLGYTHWLSGKPDDADRNENGAEQCASMGLDGTWDDQGCSAALDFFCERP